MVLRFLGLGFISFRVLGFLSFRRIVPLIGSGYIGVV